MSFPTLTPVLKIALSSRPGVEPGGGDWTDLSDRIVDDEPWVVTAGRSSVLDAFQPGRLEVTLDNSDRMLDPSNPSGLVYAADGEGLPMCWVTFDLDDGTTVERRFTGFLASPAWEGAGTRRYAGSPQRNTVRLVAEDRLAWSGDLPAEAWHVMIKALWPDWWLPMDPAFPVLVNGSAVPNRSGSGGSATVVESDANLTRTSEQLGVFAPNLKFSADHKLKNAAADVMPDGDELDFTMCLWWRLATAHSTGESSTILALTNPGGSTKRFDLIVDDNGDAIATWYDSGGSSLDSVTISKPGGRWDDNTKVFCVVRYDSGNNCEVWVNGISDTTTIAAAFVYESDIYIGPSDLDPVVDEFCVWRRMLSDADVAGLNLYAGSNLNPWDGDNFLGDGTGRNSRAEHWFLAAGIDPDFDDVDQWHLPVDDTDQGFYGLGTVSNIPSNLAEALRQMVGPNGAVWCNREGYLRVRTVEALDDATYAADYVTATATLTDENGALTGNEIRHAGVRLLGVDAEKVINRAAISFSHITDTGPPRTTYPMTIAPEGTTVLNGMTSQQKFGLREKTYSLDWYGWERAATLADALIARYEFPLPDLDRVAVDVTTSTAATWVQTFELENAVDVVYTPEGGSAVTVSGLQIQWFQLSGTSQLVRCELMLAQS